MYGMAWSKFAIDSQQTKIYVALGETSNVLKFAGFLSDLVASSGWILDDICSMSRKVTCSFL